MKYKVFVPDSDVVAGGWDKVGIIEAANEAEALNQAKKKWGDKVKVSKVK